jgi:hypothetical protein
VIAIKGIRVIVCRMDAVLQDLSSYPVALQLGTSLELGTSGAKKASIYKDLVGAVGIEIASQ